MLIGEWRRGYGGVRQGWAFLRTRQRGALPRIDVENRLATGHRGTRAPTPKGAFWPRCVAAVMSYRLDINKTPKQGSSRSLRRVHCRGD